MKSDLRDSVFEGSRNSLPLSSLFTPFQGFLLINKEKTKKQRWEVGEVTDAY